MRIFSDPVFFCRLALKNSAASSVCSAWGLGGRLFGRDLQRIAALGGARFGFLVG